MLFCFHSVCWLEFYRLISITLDMGSCLSCLRGGRKLGHLTHPLNAEEALSEAPPSHTIPISTNHHPRDRDCIIGQVKEIQHISEREPENEDSDPSINVRREIIFIKGKNRRQSWYLELLKRMKRLESRRPNTTTEMYLDCSTVSKPDSRATIRAVAIAICLLIRSGSTTGVAKADLDIFDETLHPMKIEQSPDEDPNRPPSLKTVHRFIRKIFQNAQLSPECAIVTMVYLERLLHGGPLYLGVANWKRILLCAILLASKVWDDQAVWNVDYCQILDELKVDDVNELERQFLEIIQFNINIPSSVYTKYYFDIRDLTVSTHEFTRLSVETARDLEACSQSILNFNLGLDTTDRYRLRPALASPRFALMPLPPSPSQFIELRTATLRCPPTHAPLATPPYRDCHLVPRR
ncbi:Cyclin-Y-like protein 1 [Echinococcus granulosus]|uniref:Cyclin y n=1 Tax=Echinococcus granulosus TaxID=6210 RepID=A0A068WBJ1_ECHGR|nr:Cyclin-Y-like protein 1 [Echinococcus granulosus]CDS17456.1 cyclin y [Echinococcus granulosus]